MAECDSECLLAATVHRSSFHQEPQDQPPSVRQVAAELSNRRTKRQNREMRPKSSPNRQSLGYLGICPVLYDGCHRCHSRISRDKSEINVDRFSSVLLDVWREAGRHIEIRESASNIARLLAEHLPLAHLLVRRLDATHHALETIAVGQVENG